ncbi:unnamed protein product, partial [Pleuronectes platessa]
WSKSTRQSGAIFNLNQRIQEPDCLDLLRSENQTLFKPVSGFLPSCILSLSSHPSPSHTASHTPSPPPHLAPHTVQAACQHQSRVKVNPICSVTAYAGPRYDPSEPKRNLSEPLPEPNRHLNFLSKPDFAYRIPSQDNSALIRVEARWSLEEGLCLSPGKTLTSQLKTSPPEIMSQSDASQQQQPSTRTRT